MQLSPALEKFTEETIGVQQKMNSWFLQIVGVTPEHHRKGLAKALIAVVETVVRVIVMLSKGLADSKLIDVNDRQSGMAHLWRWKQTTFQMYEPRFLPYTWS
jgi:GNAT superfamily N-acetyltransferase